MRRICKFVGFSPSLMVAGGKAGQYEAYKIIYLNEAGETKDWTKHVNGLKFKPKIKQILQGLKPMDDFWMDIEKKGEFLELVDLGAGTGELASSPIAEVTNVSVAKPAGRITGSNYETSQERADRQRYIVRQSSLSLAKDLLIAGKEKATFETVTDLAGRFEEWVFRKDIDDLVSDNIDEEIK